MRGELRVLGLLRPLGLLGQLRPLGGLALLFVALVLGGCGNSPEEGLLEPEPEEPAVTGTAICFSGRQGGGETVTKAETPLSDIGITTFTVWGYKNSQYYQEVGAYDNAQLVFPAYSVVYSSGSAGTTTTNSDGWDYFTPIYPDQTIKYWDWNSTAYRFFGVTSWGGEPPVSPASYEPNVIYGTTVNYGPNNTYTAFDMSMEVDVTTRRAIEDMPYFTTMWFSNGSDNGEHQFGTPVKLVFTKPVCKVRFMYTYVYERERILLENQEFKPTADYGSDNPGGIVRKGSFTIRYPLTGPDTQELYIMTPDNDGKLAAFLENYDPDDPTKEYYDASDGWYYVFPNLSQGSYKLSITINGSEKTCIVPAEYMRWAPGYSYTYIFKLNEKGGVDIDMVQSATTKWIEMEQPHEVYNW